MKQMEMEGRSRKNLGDMGEKVAMDFLISNGYRIVTQNFRFSRLGEVDIIARESEYICFIEVKTRSNMIFGFPSESVTKRKQLNIIKLAQIYLKKYNLKNVNVRFDVVEVLVKKNNNGENIYNINLIRNAFQLH